MLPCIPWVRFVPMLVLPLLLPLASGCVHHHHPRSVVKIASPPAAAAHGYRHPHGRVVLVFDRSLGCYVLEGHSHHYFYAQYYYRYHKGVWQRARRLEGPWIARVGSLPAGLEKRYTGSRSAQPPAAAAHDAANEGRRDLREQRREERGAGHERRARAKSQRAEEREAAREQRAKAKHRRIEEREAAREHRVEMKQQRVEAREQRAEVKEQRAQAKQQRVQAKEQRAAAPGRTEKPAGRNKAAAKKRTDAEPLAKLDEEGEELASPPEGKKHLR